MQGNINPKKKTRTRPSLRAQWNRVVMTLAKVSVLAIIACAIAQEYFIPHIVYRNALSLVAEGKYEEAMVAFDSLDGYKDSDNQSIRCKYHAALALERDGRFWEAIAAFEGLNGYADSDDHILQCKYMVAVALEESGQYEEATAVFEELNGYADSDDHILQCKYKVAVALEESGQYEVAIAVFEELNGYEDSNNHIVNCRINAEIALAIGFPYGNKLDKQGALQNNGNNTKVGSTRSGRYRMGQLSSIEPGEVFSFGMYEQDNNLTNGKEPIEWLVLDREGDRILVISKYALDCQPFNASWTAVTWETCTLRTWLNNDFLKTAFTGTEQSMIPMVSVSADRNPNYNTEPGNATRDYVFLLSIAEANRYFSSDRERQCIPTAHAKAQVEHMNSAGEFCWWWLRTPGPAPLRASFVSSDGAVYPFGDFVNDFNDAVRPALWIDLDAS